MNGIQLIHLHLAFNNTSSLPFLLTQSLDSAGLLDRLLLKGGSTSDAISRAQSYFLVCAVVGNCLTPSALDSLMLGI